MYGNTHPTYVQHQMGRPTKSTTLPIKAYKLYFKPLSPFILDVANLEVIDKNKKIERKALEKQLRDMAKKVVVTFSASLAHPYMHLQKLAKAAIVILHYPHCTVLSPHRDPCVD